MANITDAQVVKFVREIVRPAADEMAQCYNRNVAIVNTYFAQGLSTKLGGYASNDVIVDGSLEDGRRVLTAADVLNAITRLQEQIADYDAGGGAKRNTILAVAVNTTPRR